MEERISLGQCLFQVEDEIWLGLFLWAEWRCCYRHHHRQHRGIIITTFWLRDPVLSVSHDTQAWYTTEMPLTKELSIATSVGFFFLFFLECGKLWVLGSISLCGHLQWKKFREGSRLELKGMTCVNWSPGQKDRKRSHMPLSPERVTNVCFSETAVWKSALRTLAYHEHLSGWWMRGLLPFREHSLLPPTAALTLCCFLASATFTWSLGKGQGVVAVLGLTIHPMLGSSGCRSVKDFCLICLWYFKIYY